MNLRKKIRFKKYLY